MRTQIQMPPASISSVREEQRLDRLEELFGPATNAIRRLVRVERLLFYPAPLPPEVPPHTVSPCPARQLSAGVFVFDETEGSELFSCQTQHLLYVPLTVTHWTVGFVLLETECPLSPQTQLILTDATADLARHLHDRRLVGQAAPGLGDPARLLLAEQRVWLHGRPLYLSRQEYLALQRLYLSWDRPCPRAKLQDTVYPGEAPTLLQRENRLELLLSRLRKKLVIASQGQVTIEAQRGQGYRLVLTVI